MKEGLLSWSERWGSSKEEIWDTASASLKMCHTHFTGKGLWITYSRPCELVPWQPWQEGIFMLPATVLLLGAALSVSPPDPFSIHDPRSFCLFNGHCISSLLLMGSGPNFLSTSSNSDKMWEVCFEKTQLCCCRFLIGLLICLFILSGTSLLWWLTENWSHAGKMATV